MKYIPEVLQFLATPATWFLAEILAFILFFACLSDIIKKSDDKTRIFRLFELFGFIVYAGLFENIGVLGNTYNYSMDRLIMVGVVPLSILMFEAVTFYVALRFAETLEFPKWTIPFIVGILGVLQDMTIDPAAVFDLHSVNGVMEGRWNWTSHYDRMFFGIPFFNYTGWFLLMFYYTTLIQWGRKLFERSGFKYSAGIGYVTLAPLLGVALIISPLTRFILFLDPIFPVFVNRSVEIIMLCVVLLSSIVILFKYRKRKRVLSLKENRVIWLMPLILHSFDIILAFSLKITIAYIPVLLFAAIHLGYLALYFRKAAVKRPE